MGNSCLAANACVATSDKEILGGGAGKTGEGGPSSSYDYGRSTEENYGVPHFTGIHADIRPLLDYTYHRKYCPAREQMQDKLIQNICHGKPLQEQMLPWVVFTAGAMGAGKGFVMRWMHDHGYWDMDYFVKVDVDEVRQLLPEWQAYVDRDPGTAGHLTQKEAGCIAEILSYKALRQRMNIIIDGSLRDAEWYKQYILKLRREFPGIRVMILHVVADIGKVVERAKERAERTGRSVPIETLRASAEAVPKSVAALAKHVDFVCRVVNQTDGPCIQREEGAPFPPPAVEISWQVIQKLWNAIDSDGDGTLSADEVQIAIAKGLVTEATVASLDTNKDGCVSKEELQRAIDKAKESGSRAYR